MKLSKETKDLIKICKEIYNFYEFGVVLFCEDEDGDYVNYRYVSSKVGKQKLRARYGMWHLLAREYDDETKYELSMSGLVTEYGLRRVLYEACPEGYRKWKALQRKKGLTSVAMSAKLNESQQRRM